MRIAFELSGEHRTLPKAEVIGCLMSFGANFSEVATLDQVLVIEIDEMPPIAGRLAMTRHIIGVIGMCPADPGSIMALVSASNLPLGENETFCVRAKVIKEYSTLASLELERDVGAILCKKGYKVDLEKPDIIFRIVITENTCIFGRLISSIDRHQYESRRPHLKPFFYPGVLLPVVARTIVNISSVRSGELLLDPFCGTGGILVEAGLIGVNCLGIDVQRRMINGAAINLRYYGIPGELILGDACNLGIADNSVDAIATDPPYGRSALFIAKSLQDLYDESLKGIYRVLKPRKKAVVVSQTPIRAIAEDVGFKVLGYHLQRVHRSLTRHIIVLQKAESC